MKEVRPGQGVEFMYYNDYARDQIRIMRAMVFDVLDRKLILSQAQPAVLPSGVRKDIVLTYLVREQGQTARFGFKAIILEFLNHYELASGEQVPALVIERRGAPGRFNLRLNYRLKTSSGLSLSLALRNQPLNLMDISVGGARFSCPKAVFLAPHTRLKLKLGVGVQRHEIEAEVLRVWSSEDQRAYGDLQFATVRFLHAGNEVEHLLGKEIFNIERQLLAQCKERE